jgi:ribosomal protein S4E
MTYIQRYSQMVKISGDQVSDGKLNGHIMDVLQISENHEAYDIARP